MEIMNPNAQPGAPESGPSQTPSGSLQSLEKPVAYDQNGQPLYAHPQQEEQLMYLTRPYEPPKQELSPELQQKAADSRKRFPNLNLSEGEYIITMMKRHPIGLFKIWSLTIILCVLFAGLFAVLLNGSAASGLLSSLGDENTVRIGGALVVALFSLLFIAGGMIASYVYSSNKFYLTNESIIQETRTSLFGVHEQTASLGSIEDASYTQDGFIATMLNYGTVRLSTPGDESTYTFTYVASPKQHIATLNNAVEAFKNGRPVGH